ncbi:MAG: extracellular solute-binding protein, partial [Sporomusaceae bacterium]|nr:extracellular solute-binding protein [Sporomusaceae bacterium]
MNLGAKKYLLLSIVLLATSLSGCSVSQQNNPVVVTMWHIYVEQMRTGMDELVEEFNATVGKEEGIIVKVTAVANTPVINEKLLAAANRDPGAPDLPNMAVIYPNIAVHLSERGLLMDFAEQFNEKELARYVKEFLEEGKLGGKRVYLLPLAKSTEVLYVNKTFFDRFSEATGTQLSQLQTFEGLLDAAQKYYAWTDAKTPDIPDDGQQFYYPDNLFHYTMI